MKVLLRIAQGLAYLVSFVVQLVVFTLGHLNTPVGRATVHDVANRVLADLFTGRLVIGSVDHIGIFGTLQASHAYLYDAQGHPIAEDAALDARPLYLLLNAIRRVEHASIPALRLHVAVFRLVPDAEGLPTIASAFTLRHPAPPTPPPAQRESPFIFGNLHVTIDRLESTMGGQNVRAADVQADGAFITSPLQLHATGTATRIDLPQMPPLRLTANFDWDPPVGAHPDPNDIGTMRATTQMRGDGIDCTAGFTKHGDDLTLTADRCRAEAALLARVSGQPVLVPVFIDHASVVLGAASAPIRIAASGNVGAGTFAVDGSLVGMDGGGTLTVHGIDLSQIVLNLPVVRLDGVARVDVHRPNWSLDASQLGANFAGTVIPSITAHGTFDEHTVTVAALDAPAVGLHAHGHVQLDGDHRAVLDATVHTHDVGTLPFVNGVAHGALDLEAHVERDDHALHANYHATVQSLAVSGNRIASANVRGTASMVGDQVGIDANVAANGVVIPGQGIANVTAHVRGDPLHAIDADVHAAALLNNVAQRTTPLGSVAAPPPNNAARVDGHVHVALGTQAIDVDVRDLALAARGATGRLQARVAIPRGAGRPSGSAHLTTSTGGDVQLTLAGNRVAARVQRFDVAWVGQALGMGAQCGGTVEGNLAIVTAPLENPNGSIDWRNGRLPNVGAFNLHADLRSERGATHLEASFAMLDNLFTGSNGTPATLHIVADAHPPRELGSTEGWIAGIERVDVTSDPLPLRLIEAFLPHGARVSGNAAIAAHAERAEHEGRRDLDFRLTADASDVRAYAEVSDMVPAALRGVIARSVSPRPLTVALDTRFGVCGSIDPRNLARIPLRFAATLSRDDGATGTPPDSCESVVIAGHPTLLALTTAIGSSWPDTLATAFAEYQRQSADVAKTSDIALSDRARAALAATTVQANLAIGPLSASEWPFTDAAGQLISGLARPPIDGRFAGTLTVGGTMSEPDIELRGQLQDATVPIFVSRDQIGAQLHASLTSRWQGSPAHHHVALLLDASADLHERGPHPVAGSAGRASAQARLESPLAAMVDPDQGLQPADVRLLQVQTTGLRLGALRWARAHNVDGRVAVTLSETGDEFAAVAAGVTVTDLTVRGRPGAAATMSAFLRRVQNEWSIQSCLTATSRGRVVLPCDPDVEAETAPNGGLIATVHVPLGTNLFAFTPDMTGVGLALAATQFQLESIGPFVANGPLLSIAGNLSGHAAWTAAASCSLDSSLHLDHGTIEIEKIGQPAQNVALDLEASGRHGQIRSLSIGLSEGTLTAHGPLEFCPANNALAHIALDARAQQFPALVEGSNFANLTGTLSFAADVHRDHLDAQLHIDRLDVNLPEQASRSVQELDPHPDVDIVGDTIFDPNAIPPQPYPISISFDSANPIWIRRDDVQVALRAHGSVRVEPAGTVIAGQIDLALRQSYFEVFGKRFYLDRVTVHLEDPENPLRFNPLLDVAAHYDSTSTGRIDITVAERLDNPQITFTSEQFAGASQSEILSMLVLGRRDTRGPSDQQAISEQAQQAAASLIAGFALGLGVSGATSLLQHGTRNLGFVPRLIAEPGADLQSSRFGGGVTANRFYVEGTVGGSSNGGTSSGGAAQGAEARVLVEWAFKDPFSLGGFFGYNTASSTSNVRFGVDLFVTP